MALLELLLQNRFSPDLVGTPGINPNAPDPRLQIPGTPPPVTPQAPQGSLLSPILSRLGPLGKGADSLLQGVGGATRNAALSGSLAALAPRTTQGILQGAQNRRADSQEERANSLAELQRQLIESQIGLNNQRIETGDPQNTNVQSTFRGSNGNMFIVTRNGDVKDTGVAFNESLRTVTRPDGSVVLVDDTRGGRSEPVEVVTPEEAVTGASNRKGAEQAASTAAQQSTQQQFDIPRQIKSADTQIRKIDSTLEEANRALGLVSGTSAGPVGNFLKGFPGTDAFALQEAIKPIKAALSFDTLTEMRAASPSGGALGSISERELDLLGSAITSLNQAQSPGDVKRALTKVITHYDNWRSVIERQRGSLEEQSQDSVAGFRIVNENN